MKQSWWQRLRAWFGATEPLSAEEVERLRASFRSRYSAFRRLLAANHRALEAMTDIEHSLSGERPIDLSYVRQRYTQAGAAVYQMIGSLARIAPGKHEALSGRFQEIQARVDAVLRAPEPDSSLPLVLSLRGLTAGSAGQVGMKMALLAELGTVLGLPVPHGFVSTALAEHRFMQHQGLGTEINRLIQVGGTGDPEQLLQTSQRIRELIAQADLPTALEQSLLEHRRQLLGEVGDDAVLVLRSSALGEDAPGRSHAGIYESIFDVTGENFLESFKQVIASKYSPQAMAYRLSTGLRDDTEVMCVGCMPLIEARAGGVVYSRNPIAADDDAVFVHSVWGMPRSVVAGSDTADVYEVSRDGPRLRASRVARKREQYVYARKQRRSVLEETGSRAAQPSLTDEQVLELVRLVLEIERFRDEPQDVEFALTPQGSFVVLQSRPLEQSVRASDDKAIEEIRGAGPPLLTGGVTASPGVGAGPVHLVRNLEEIRDFPPGAVMLTHQPVPEWALALERAAAVVAEQGGVAGHLANVAREFEVPALFGLAGATATLAAGSVVTVDANGRAVYAGRFVAPEGSVRSKKRRLSGSPVFRTLEQVAQHVVPLRMLDPESPSFAAGNCETLHDITRFCHEQAVREMFRFGADHRFPGGAAKQLKCEVPMQFWIIDLDDGLRETATEEQYVLLDDVISLPMRALWRGMTAVAWEGPPPVDARGFMDVLMQSATNPELVPSAPSRFALRNYFMIARNFCSLQSRFGYHYSTVETTVSERTIENYASLQFKAGAAGADRRHRRARLIAAVLEEQQFRTVVEGDLVRARIEGLERAQMENRLVVIGHLLIHTRQLDMAMVDDRAVERHKRKLLEQVERLGLAAS